MNKKELNKKTKKINEEMGKLKYVESAFGYIPILEVKEYNLLVPFTDNLENITTNHDGAADSRGIAHVKDGKFLDIKAEGYGGIKTEIISADKAVELILKHQKYELLDEFGLKGLALEMVSI